MTKISTRADIITRRTYSRPLEDETDTFETWDDTCQRVIAHQAWLWERALTHKEYPEYPLHDLSEDMKEWIHLREEQIDELNELYNLMYNRKVMPAGRTLWLGGTEVSRRRESSMFNCSHTNIETIYDVVDAFWLLLQGCGVGFTPVVGTLTGFRKPIPQIEVIRSTRKRKGGQENNEEEFTEDGVWIIRVGDSAESWAKSIGKLLAGKFEARKLVFDFSEIRPAGERLKGYGWISSGDDSISIAYPAIASILNRRSGALLNKIDILDILNWLGTVLSSRRSAEIALCEYGSAEWYEFATAKERCYEEGFKHRQQSNNSLVFYRKPTEEELIELFDLIVRNGGSEPGLVNGETALKRAPWFHGLNPCAEILLANKSFCNLVEVDVSKFYGDSAGLYRAITLAARMNFRQTVVDFRDGVLQEAWHLNNEFLRLCGVGVTGIAQREDLSEFDWKSLKYSAVTAARIMAKELNLQHPKNVTTVKPSGCRDKDGLITTEQGIFTLEELMHNSDTEWGNIDNINIIQDNNNNKAVKSYKNGKGEALKIKLSYGMELISTPNHEWFVTRRNRPSCHIPSKKFESQWIKAENLIIGKDYLDIKLGIFNSTPSIKLNTIEQSNINNTQTIIQQPKYLTDDLSWLLGYLWGDGSLSPHKYRIRFIDEHEYNLIKVQKILKDHFNIDCNIHPASQERNAKVIEVGCKNLWDWIIANDFYKYKENNILNNIPLKVRKNKNHILAFIAGLIDSDGCVSKHNGTYRFTISNSQDEFSRHLQDICWSVGIGVGKSLNSKGNNFQNEKHIWLLTNAASYINKDSFNILQINSNKINKATDLPWNFETIKRCSKIAGRIESIEILKNIETFDIEVENDPWYYAGAVKSHNTVSKIMDTTEGIHKPLGRYIFNWVNFSKRDPIVDIVKASNYKVIDNPSDTTGCIVCLPVEWSHIEFDIVQKGDILCEVNLESAVSQLDRYLKIQNFYCDHNVSNTISYDIDEVPDIIKWLLQHWDSYVAVSFLFRTDPTKNAKDLGYEYLPQEVVTEEEYKRYVDQLLPVNFDIVHTYDELDEDECLTGACPIK